MITYKVTSQEYSVSYKEEDEIGDEYIEFEEYADERAMLLTLAVGEPTDENVPDSEKEQLEECLEHLKSELKSDGGFWSSEWGGVCEDYEYYGRPEPCDGYGASGTFHQYELVDAKNVLRDKISHLSSKKEDILIQISELSNEVQDIDSELETLTEK
jgi:hypothetical protein